MKFLKPWLTALTAGALLFASNLFAQDVPTPPESNSASGSANYSTAQGELTVRSAPAPAPEIGPAPAFEQLSNGAKSITEDQASAYPPLANDFIHADSNRDGRVSKAEYSRWTGKL